MKKKCIHLLFGERQMIGNEKNSTLIKTLFQQRNQFLDTKQNDELLEAINDL